MWEISFGGRILLLIGVESDVQSIYKQFLLYPNQTSFSSQGNHRKRSLMASKVFIKFVNKQLKLRNNSILLYILFIVSAVLANMKELPVSPCSQGVYSLEIRLFISVHYRKKSLTQQDSFSFFKVGKFVLLKIYIFY